MSGPGTPACRSPKLCSGRPSIVARRTRRDRERRGTARRGDQAGLAARAGPGRSVGMSVAVVDRLLGSLEGPRQVREPHVLHPPLIVAALGPAFEDGQRVL